MPRRTNSALGRDPTITGKVAALLEGHPRVMYCDACIQAELKLRYRDSANSATRFLTRSSQRHLVFTRVLGLCISCSGKRLVTFAV